MLGRIRSERGDTIVEVMIAIVVASMVLVAAYVTTTRNINAMQNTGEHSAALQLAQTQLEYLHNITLSKVIAGGCFDNTGTPTTTCTVKADGSPAGSAQPAFLLQITPPGGTHPNSYAVQVQWSGAGSNTTNGSNVTLYYQP
jgi:Tfp pilus assembly protein PilE